ncbi:MAG: nucleotidyltransferase [Spirochaetaceae bacterium]|jgi:predicted nucleotidyltransferase|nr:nucleotidyltransferase [Spirochaetaceae bacterium]
MNIQPDFEELLKLLKEHNVSFYIVGGYAVAFYGYPRFTKDIDIFFKNDNENIERLTKALIDFGFSQDQLSVEIFSTPGNIIKFGVEPLRIDLLNEIDGIHFEEVEQDFLSGKYGSVKVDFIGKKSLIKNKTASGRFQDLADLEKLKDEEG